MTFSEFCEMCEVTEGERIELLHWLASFRYRKTLELL